MGKDPHGPFKGNMNIIFKGKLIALKEINIIKKDKWTLFKRIIKNKATETTCEHSSRDEEPVCTFFREWDSSARRACKSARVQEIDF